MGVLDWWLDTLDRYLTTMPPLVVIVTFPVWYAGYTVVFPLLFAGHVVVCAVRSVADFLADTVRR